MRLPRDLSGDPAADFLLGGGEMGARMREMDWSRTPLGPAETWPRSLKTSISIMLASRFAMVVAWGPEFRFFYNDRYRPVLGSTKHPGALGHPPRRSFRKPGPSSVLFSRAHAGGNPSPSMTCSFPSIAMVISRIAISRFPTARSAMNPAASAACSPSLPRRPRGWKANVV